MATHVPHTLHTLPHLKLMTTLRDIIRDMKMTISQSFNSDCFMK